MFFTYRYLSHPIQGLHRAVHRFIRALADGALDPVRFDPATCCTGELLARVNASPRLRERVEAFYLAWFQLDAAQRDVVEHAFIVSNSVKRQLDGTLVRAPIDTLPEPIIQPAAELFAFMYKNSLRRTLRIDHWGKLYKTISTKTCPFCGIEPIHDASLTLQDYDHLLCKSSYPFTAVNLVNLVPCGADCNRIFKHEADIIWNAEEGRRRRAFFPFRPHGTVLAVDLTGSRLPQTDRDVAGWNVSITPASEEVDTWVKVFDLKRRYQLDVLGKHYDRWRQDFVDALAIMELATDWDEASVRYKMRLYVSTLSNDPLLDMRFLQWALFEFLLTHADSAFFLAIAAELNDKKAR